MQKITNLTRRNFLSGVTATSFLRTGSLWASEQTPLVYGDRFLFVPGDSGQIAAVDILNGQLETILHVPHDIGAVVASDLYNALFVTDPIGQQVSVIDLAAREIAITNPLGMRPDLAVANPLDNAIAYGGRDGVISVWGHRHNAEIARAEGLGAIQGMTFGRHGRHLYAVQSGVRDISVLDLAENKLNDPIVLEGASNVPLEPMSRSLDGGTGLISLPDLNQLAILDLTQNTVYDSLNIAADPRRPYATGDGEHFLVPHGEGHAVTVIARRTLDVVAVVELDYPLKSIVTGWLDMFAFAVPETGTDMAVIDLRDYREIARVSLSNSAGAGLVSADTRVVAVTHPDRGQVALIDTAGQRVAVTVDTALRDLRSPTIALSGDICH